MRNEEIYNNISLMSNWADLIEAIFKQAAKDMKKGDTIDAYSAQKFVESEWGHYLYSSMIEIRQAKLSDPHVNITRV